jgi:hypothetical protein
MRVLIAQGADFRNVVTEGLRSTMGESPAEILLNMVGTSAFVNPAIFAAEVHKLFGKGADSIYESVQKYAAESLEHPDANNQPVYDQLWRKSSKKKVPHVRLPSEAASRDSFTTFETRTGERTTAKT